MKLISNTQLEEFFTEINKLIISMYPVGSIIYTNSDTNPSTKLGGTWKLLDGNSYFLRANSTNNGSNSITLDHWAEHNHDITYNNKDGPDNRNAIYITRSTVPEITVSLKNSGISTDDGRFTIYYIGESTINLGEVTFNNSDWFNSRSGFTVYTSIYEGYDNTYTHTHTIDVTNYMKLSGRITQTKYTGKRTESTINGTSSYLSTSYGFSGATTTTPTPVSIIPPYIQRYMWEKISN